MKTLTRFAVVSASCAVALLSLLTPSCGGSALQNGTGSASGSAGISGGGAPSTDTCTTADDCTWSEIAAEISKPSDCMCLYGCGSLPQTKTTAARRAQQHAALCNPNKDGKGQTCAIDDCVAPGKLSCVAGTCQPATGGTSGTQ
jgi:hypothetical protein